MSVQRRTERFEIRVSPDELELIRGAAASASMKPGPFFREIVVAQARRIFASTQPDPPQAGKKKPPAAGRDARAEGSSTPRRREAPTFAGTRAASYQCPLCDFTAKSPKARCPIHNRQVK